MVKTTNDISDIIKTSRDSSGRISDATNGLSSLFLKNVSTPEKMYDEQSCLETERLLNEVENACHKLPYQPFVPKGYEKSNQFLLQAEKEYAAYVELSRKALKEKSTDIDLEAGSHLNSAVELEIASLKALPK